MGEWKYSSTVSSYWQLIQMSGHIHNLSVSFPGKELFVPIGNRVNPRSNLDGAEKRKISAFARIRIHYPCLGLRQYFK
jgi:hypothetical protein